MNKTYFIIPILALAAFTATYINSKSEIDQIEHQKKVLALEAKKQKDKAEVDARNKAYDDAVALGETRKREIAIKKALDEENAKFRRSLEDTMVIARNEKVRQENQVKRVNDELKVEKEALEKIRKELTVYQKEIDNQMAVVKKTEANQKYYEQVLTKIQAAEEAKEAAEKAAASAAAAKKNA